jgi:hypothetical protein
VLKCCETFGLFSSQFLAIFQVAQLSDKQLPN